MNKTKIFAVVSTAMLASSALMSSLAFAQASQQGGTQQVNAGGLAFYQVPAATNLNSAGALTTSSSAQTTTESANQGSQGDTQVLAVEDLRNDDTVGFRVTSNIAPGDCLTDFCGSGGNSLVLTQFADAFTDTENYMFIGTHLNGDPGLVFASQGGLSINDNGTGGDATDDGVATGTMFGTAATGTDDNVLGDYSVVKSPAAVSFARASSNDVVLSCDESNFDDFHDQAAISARTANCNGLDGSVNTLYTGSSVNILELDDLENGATGQAFFGVAGSFVTYGNYWQSFVPADTYLVLIEHTLAATDDN